MPISKDEGRCKHGLKEDECALCSGRSYVKTPNPSPTGRGTGIKRSEIHEHRLMAVGVLAVQL